MIAFINLLSTLRLHQQSILSINLSNCLIVEKLVFKPRKLEILLR